MNERKKHVIKMAHQLFMEKGFQATSIQDILTYSGISKGTFYNYFSSKSELLIALFKTIYKQLEIERNDLLIGQDPSNIEIFIKQIELQLETNRANKLISLFEEVIFSKDEELKQFLKRGHLRILRWTYYRFIDIFGEDKEPYLLDCAVMFMGILQHNLKYNNLAYESNVSLNKIVRYCVNRMVKIVNEVAEAGDQLLKPELLANWLPNCKGHDHVFKNKLYHSILEIKKTITHHAEQSKYTELMDFIQEEIIDSKKPRKFLIEMALQTLKMEKSFIDNKGLQKLEQLIADYFTQIEELD
ncbi:TetR/AcrR family transcriptional regulator [Bacillus sp. DTU_2020_1000418_1_SI_GHA_SEK_038]|uniref:TetR/AcrR family transcriptional regulator n=1 Tax=Bacillus sp. DTU_2020_1000418_1_SI_GHA_SEK_038 TaxID=3077585 RepID=UPI0028F10080|nr:TetR/AcrR family transcriptional regulator [Bacillus sp. DTU_2020_1000418_1_SI_GHA_SEK_038]WNS76094.1 TetR/AcrR family transcriptional regulator [Bacillus sp. DTU_2020_1000418_1_SI_GHA_SEK_038]